MGNTTSLIEHEEKQNTKDSVENSNEYFGCCNMYQSLLNTVLDYQTVKTPEEKPIEFYKSTANNRYASLERSLSCK